MQSMDIVLHEELHTFLDELHNHGWKATHIQMYEWSYSKSGASRNGVAVRWLVVSESSPKYSIS